MRKAEQTNPNDHYADDEIDLKKFFGVLWGGKKLIILITSVVALCSVLFAFTLTNYYKSEAILSLTGTTNSSRSMSSSFGGLAAMAGIALPTSDVENKASLVLATIKSRVFLKHLITFDKVLPSLMAVKTFDAKNKILIFDEDTYNIKSNTWVGNVDPPYQSAPSVLEVYKAYISAVNANQDHVSSLNLKTGFINISVEHQSPIFAKEFLDLIIREVNVLLRQRDLEESTNALEYLKSEISKTSLIEIKNSMNELIKTQLETQMMANIGNDYVLRTIEPPFVPEQESRPNKSFISILGTMFGGMFGIAWVLIRHYALGVGKQESES